jgi:hypothetical protein
MHSKKRLTFRPTPPKMSMKNMLIYRDFPLYCTSFIALHPLQGFQRVTLFIRKRGAAAFQLMLPVRSFSGVRRAASHRRFDLGKVDGIVGPMRGVRCPAPVPATFAALDRRGIVRHSTRVRLAEDRVGRRVARVADPRSEELERFWRRVLGFLETSLGRVEDAAQTRHGA